MKDPAGDWETVACAVCGETENKLLFPIRSFRIVECRRCGLAYTNPRLSKTRLASVYDGSYFRSQDSLLHGYDDYEAERGSIEKTFRERWDRLMKFSSTPKGSVLDIGCAFGYLLAIAREQGWNTQGVDASETAVRAARALGLSVDKSDLSRFPFEDGSFDVVVAWDVIEHVTDPMALLGHVFRMLRPGGIFSIITPDQRSLTARVLGRRWAEYQKPDEHLTFFSKRLLRSELEKKGFRIEWSGTAGKHVSVEFALKRLQSITPLFSWAARKTRSLGIGDWHLKINPLDKMSLVARAIK